MRCLTLARSDPQQAYDQARLWHSKGGSIPAEHCESVALVGLKRYSEAARKLTDLAHDKSDAGMRVQLLDQAGNAWLLAEQPGRALPLFTEALAAAPKNVDILADRALARAMHHDWHGAETDLTQALGLDSHRADLLVLWASAREAMGKLREARADIDRALTILPAYPEALVERGTLKLRAGDMAGAKSDWQSVVEQAPQSDAGVAARKRLEELKSAATRK
jgi:tetratricopeptide (TPR) repeat protein